MLRRLLIASVCTTVLGLVAPATASSAGEVSASDRAVVPVKKVVRQYGDGPVVLAPGQRLVLRFQGRRGDRVRLASQYRSQGKPYYASLYDQGVSLNGPHTRARSDASGFFRLRESGWFSLRYDNPARNAAAVPRVQLLKQVRLTHDGRSTTRLPLRRGMQYAVTVRAPRSGLEVVSFGTELFGVVSQGGYSYSGGGQALVVAPGLPVVGDNPHDALTKALAPRQRVLVLVNPSQAGSVTTSVPTEAGPVSLDGPAVPLPGGGTQGVVAELEAADIAVSAQRLLNARLVGSQAKRDWSVLVLPETGGVAKPSSAAYALNGPDATSLYQLAATTGTYRVLAFPTSRTAPAGQLELDSVADGGTIAVDAPSVAVSARPDGRYTLLGITQVKEFAASYLSVSNVTVTAPWAVYAGRLTSPRCPPRGPLGCGDGNGVSVSSGGAGNSFQYGGYVLTMPMADQTTGSFSVRLTTIYTP